MINIFIIVLFSFNERICLDYNKQVLPQIPQEIGSKLLKNEDYTVESQIRLDVFQNFLDYWKTSKEPKINSDNLFEYHLLSQEFGLMKDILSKKTDGKDFHISSLKYILNLNDQNTLLDSSSHERYIALHLDSFQSVIRNQAKEKRRDGSALSSTIFKHKNHFSSS